MGGVNFCSVLESVTYTFGLSILFPHRVLICPRRMLSHYITMDTSLCDLLVHEKLNINVCWYEFVNFYFKPKALPFVHHK